MLPDFLSKLLILIDDMLEYGSETIGKPEGPQLFFTIIEFVVLVVIIFLVIRDLRYFLVEKDE